MTIQEFAAKYGDAPKPIHSVVDRWVLEKQVDDLLGTTITGGVVIADLCKDGQLVDSIPAEVRAAFKELMKEKADTVEEIKTHLLEKTGDSLDGLRRKIQGTMGELAFKNNTSGGAELAPLGNQRGWDVRVPRGSDEFQYVQVKVYEDADGVIRKMQQVQEELAAGLIKDSEQVVRSIDFAVNEDIYDDVQQMAIERGLPCRVLRIGETREHFTDALNEAVECAGETPLENFFEELMGGVCTGAALHAAVNGFLVWKGAKEQEEAIEDTAYSSLITAGGLTSAYVAEAILVAQLESAAAVLATPVGAIALAGVGIYTRAILRRLADRRHFAKRLMAGNQELRVKFSKLSDPTIHAKTVARNLPV